MNGTIFFPAYDGVHGTELWRSDGTAAGTLLAADVNPGAAGSRLDDLTVAGGKLFFSAFTGRTGTELWALLRNALYLPWVARRW